MSNSAQALHFIIKIRQRILSLSFLCPFFSSCLGIKEHGCIFAAKWNINNIRSRKSLFWNETCLPRGNKTAAFLFRNSRLMEEKNVDLLGCEQMTKAALWLNLSTAVTCFSVFPQLTLFRVSGLLLGMIDDFVRSGFINFLNHHLDLCQWNTGPFPLA